MTRQTENTVKDLLILVPACGITLFTCLYIISAFFYPGGSNANPQSTGFDWLHNYWCDLTAELAKNGKINSARPIALTAMLILCFSMTVFWFFVPTLFKNIKYAWLIRYAGISAMLITVFLFTDFHDTVINTAGMLGILALAITFYGLYKNGLQRLFSAGLFCLFLMLLNYFIYTTGFFISLLPVVQKVTFIIFLSWICFLNVELYRKTRSRKSGIKR